MGLIIVIIIYALVIIYILKHKSKGKSDKISFDEFDDIEEIKKQEAIKRQSIEYESEVLKKVYKDTYNMHSNASLNFIKQVDAVLKADDAANKTREDFYNFDLIDSIDIDDEPIKEGVPINAIKEAEKDLDIELFKKWSRQIFGCIKIGKDEQLKVIRNFISDDLYDKFIFQIKQFEKDGLEFVTEDLLIKDCKIYDYRKSLNKEEIIIYIDSKMKEYIIRKSDNKIIKGNKDKFYNKKVLMTFTKKEKKEQEGIIHNCPNCGGVIDQTEFGKCRYCSTLIFPIRYNWTLTKFETL